MSWSGRYLGGREVRFYRKLANVRNVPRLLGTIGRYGFVHEYVPGKPLSKGVNVPIGFFDKLQKLLAQLHERGIAYVDTNKSPNILVGDDGEPYLIDFQISWDLFELGDNALNRWWLGRLQRADRYHFLKHKRRFCSDEMTQEELEVVTCPSALIRIHRLLTKPYFLLRRSTFRRLRHAGHVIPETMA